MKSWKFTVTIREGNSEFWEGLKDPGIKEVKEMLERALDDAFILDYDVDLKEYLYRNE